MDYPDGGMIQTGDLVWWNEGACVGYVQAVIENQDDLTRFGLKGPHLFLSNLHPYRPEETGIAYAWKDLHDEGIGPLTSPELDEFVKAKELARIDDREFSVFTECLNGKMTHWRFEIHTCESARRTVNIPVGQGLTKDSVAEISTP